MSKIRTPYQKIVRYEIQIVLNLTKACVYKCFSTIKEWERAKRWGKTERSLIFDIKTKDITFAVKRVRL